MAQFWGPTSWRQAASSAQQGRDEVRQRYTHWFFLPSVLFANLLNVKYFWLWLVSVTFPCLSITY